MSIPLLPEFDADGYQVEPTTADINDLIAATNTATGAEIATLPTFPANGQQTEPSIAKLNEIITALNDGGAELDLLPTFAADGYETLPTTVTFNAVTTFVNEYEPPASDPVIESIASSPVYDGEWTMPAGIQAGDLLLAVVVWGNETAAPIDGFTILETGGVDWDHQIFQYKIATGDEPAAIVPDPSWGQEEGVIVRISGVNQSDPIILAGAPERIEGSTATSKTLELDSISPDSAGILAIIAIGSAGGTERTLTVEGEPIATYAYDGTYAHGATLETLAESGATGTRTVVLSTGAASASTNLLAAMVALNPA